MIDEPNYKLINPRHTRTMTEIHLVNLNGGNASVNTALFEVLDTNITIKNLKVIGTEPKALTVNTATDGIITVNSANGGDNNIGNVSMCVLGFQGGA